MTSPGAVRAKLCSLLTEAGQAPLELLAVAQFEAYFELLLRWNARTNLTAIREPDEILRRHFIESIACARAIPAEASTLLDFGSGAGFPGLPIALCRPEISVTLAESQGKKAAFLREAVRTLGLQVEVHSGRAETLATRFDCVVLRAVDHMDLAVRTASTLLQRQGWLAPLTTLSELSRVEVAAGEGFVWESPINLPGSRDRQLLLGHKKG